MTSCVQQQKDDEQLLEQLNASDDEINDSGDIAEEEEKDKQLLTEPTFCFSVCIQKRKEQKLFILILFDVFMVTVEQQHMLGVQWLLWTELWGAAMRGMSCFSIQRTTGRRVADRIIRRRGLWQ